MALYGLLRLNSFHPLETTFRAIAAKRLPQEVEVSGNVLPAKPRRPLNSYMRFFVKYGQDVLGKNPNLSREERVKLISDAYGKLSEQEKQKLRDEAKSEWAVYGEEYEKYKNLLLKHEIDQLKKLDPVRTKVVPKPKRPASSFLKFLCSVQDQIDPDKNKNFVAKVMWDDLPTSDKLKFKMEFENEYEQYQKDLLKWEELMISNGQYGFVRSKTLKDKGIFRRHMRNVPEHKERKVKVKQ